jgi:hypothetical protein
MKKTFAVFFFLSSFQDGVDLSFFSFLIHVNLIYFNAHRSSFILAEWGGSCSGHDHPMKAVTLQNEIKEMKKTFAVFFFLSSFQDGVDLSFFSFLIHVKWGKEKENSKCLFHFFYFIYFNAHRSSFILAEWFFLSSFQDGVDLSFFSFLIHVNPNFIMNFPYIW